VNRYHTKAEFPRMVIDIEGHGQGLYIPFF
jgi:hypothetical protein